MLLRGGYSIVHTLPTGIGCHAKPACIRTPRSAFRSVALSFSGTSAPHLPYDQHCPCQPTSSLHQHPLSKAIFCSWLANRVLSACRIHKHQKAYDKPCATMPAILSACAFPSWIHFKPSHGKSYHTTHDYPQHISSLGVCSGTQLPRHFECPWYVPRRPWSSRWRFFRHCSSCACLCVLTNLLSSSPRICHVWAGPWLSRNLCDHPHQPHCRQTLCHIPS